MEKSVYDHLVAAFEDLGRSHQKKFKSKLRDRKQEPCVRKRALELAEEAEDLADLMIDTFTSDGAAAITIDILEAIQCNEQAKKLRENTQPKAETDSAASSDLKIEDYLTDECQEHLTLCRPEFKNKILKEQGSEIYESLDKSKRKRLALLITNVQFKLKTLVRNGADKDEKNMEELLRQLGYDVVKHKDLTGTQMDDAIKNFAQRDEHKNSDSTFVVIMSHGMLGAILGIDFNETNNDVLPVDNIYNHLNSVKCPSLRDKPKVILIQACRGEEHGRVWVKDMVPEEKTKIEGDDFVHREKDFISVLSCTPETKSYRHVEEGTFYVWCILKVFRQFAHVDHIEELFRKVMRCFESEILKMGTYKQMVCKDRATLTRLFYLFPGL